MNTVILMATWSGLLSSVCVADEVVVLNGVSIHYTVEGCGEPVVLIHGYASNAEDEWKETGLVNKLAKSYKVITLDLRGHGKSSKPRKGTSQYGMEMAKDVIRLLDHLQIKRAHMVGYSMGGFIVMKLMVDYPERFLTATLGGSGGVREDFVLYEFCRKFAKSLESGKPFVEALADNWKRVTGKPLSPEERREVLKSPSREDTKAMASVVRSWHELEVSSHDLKRNRVPSLVIYGSREFAKTLPYIEALNGMLGKAEFFRIENASHFDAVAHPEFSRRIKAFLAKRH